MADSSNNELLEFQARVERVIFNILECDSVDDLKAMEEALSGMADRKAEWHLTKLAIEVYGSGKKLAESRGLHLCP